MIQLPKKIKDCPITEAVLEFRYDSDYPSDAIFGMLYGAIKDFFSEKPVSLPILQLPETVRMQDPNLKYHAYHRLINDNIILNIGPRVLTFSNMPPYNGWNEWSKFFYAVYDKIIKAKVLSKVERIGLRYINCFNESIFDKVKVEVKVNNEFLSEESTNLRTEIIEDQFIKILQIGNSVNVAKDNQVTIGSIIDIDVLYLINDSSNFFENYHSIIEDAHNKEKELFFSLLEESFLMELGPIYGE